MKPLLILLLVSVAYNVTMGQIDSTFILAEGKIFNTSTKEPVAAKITYKSLPFGSKTGFLTGDSYSFEMFDNEKYSIEVVANGFAPAKFILDPAEANAEKKVIKDIELGLPNSAAQVAEITHTVGKVMRLDNLIFSAGTSKIDPTSYQELGDVVQMLNNNPKMIIQLEGHTDVQGSPTANLKLSEDRVAAVKNYLTSKGANKNRIKTKAFGGTQPLSRENTEQAHKLNRRVELRILQN